MKLVAPRLGRDQNRWPRALAIFGGVVVGQDLEFLDGIDVGENCNSAFIQLVVVIAIEQPVRTLFTRTTDGQRERATSGRFTAGRPCKETIRIRGLSCPRR